MATIRNCRRWHLILVVVVWWSTAMPAAAVTIKFDYSYDTSGFFGGGNPQGAGAQAKASLEAAAGFFTNILSNSFSAITVPQPFKVSPSDVSWKWTRSFSHPSSTTQVTLTHDMPETTIAANDYVIFAGARNIAGNTVGIGSTGGHSWSASGSYHPSHESQINSITNTFKSQVEQRGQPVGTGFSRWGGSISFDRVPPAPWHYNHTVAPSGNVIDFFSVAVHELGHALGFGTAPEWGPLVSGSNFIGTFARSANGGSPVPLADTGHWANSVISTVYGGAASQQTAMSPSLTNGTRKYFTELDAAAMKDIGWSVIPLPGVFGDYNNNGVVDAADYVTWRKYLGKNVTIPNDATPGTVRASDYTVWRQNFGKTQFGGAGSAVLVATPEPGSAMLALVACAVVSLTRRKRRG